MLWEKKKPNQRVEHAVENAPVTAIISLIKHNFAKSNNDRMMKKSGKQ